ncbi:hypothetical protein Desaci_2793 [Desulfosporosinus acidiphilus SJ4]|uniref:Uncharacterized protein n=1 Tax=Desulfosporosinus acidiphilus (strain DSM 22704 / JCM 16185 / SJ4) TaxID=646529 RepID=I4D7E4_DESAJ|nr:hypothetical protein [Desulfosporosinus acidiphilus]AFM41718.1 hypothetical protein Desaci_2793 [Desulfosporosinus acidiphilus SJ4]
MKNILKKVLTVIEGSLPVPDGAVNSNSSPEESGTVTKIGDTEVVQALKELAVKFAEALTHRDYECLDGRAEYYLYTVDHLVELIKNNDEQNTINFLTENKVKSKFEDCEFLSISISEERDEAEVVCNVITCVTSAEDKFFKELNKKNHKKNSISKGTPFSTKYTLSVKSEKGTWKIAGFNTSEENLRIDRNF